MLLVAPNRRFKEGSGKLEIGFNVPLLGTIIGTLGLKLQGRPFNSQGPAGAAARALVHLEIKCRRLLERACCGAKEKGLALQQVAMYRARF